MVLSGFKRFSITKFHPKTVVISKMKYFVVYLKCKRYLAVPKHWIENPIVGQPSTVFYCGNGNTLADFSLDNKHYVDERVNACYDGFVLKSFDSYETAKDYASNKRIVAPVQYNTLTIFDFSGGRDSEPVDLIEISDSDTSNSNVRFFLENFK